ncbi:MAG: type secretion system protein [Haloplasmataceae bacterium]|jgi:type II secretory pathway component PulF|nr:type secretion system protein [Haloplasmataceae bacterium]
MNIYKQYEFIKMLNGLFKRGYTLSESLNMMTNVNNKLIAKIKSLLDCGISIAQVFKQLKFLKIVYETIEIGESTNRLNDVINMIENYLIFYIQTKNQINKVLMYPSMLLFMAIVGIEFIRIKLYPVINTLLSDFNVEQNQMIIFISFNLIKILGIILLLVTIFAYIYKPIQNMIPVIKTYRSLYISHNLKILLACGNSLETSLFILGKSLKESIYDLGIIRKSMFDTTYKIPLFSAFSSIFIYFFKLGINSNNLFVTLDDFTIIYFDYLNNQLTKIIYYIQFIIFTLLAINIVLIYYVIMIPMFSITQNI